MSRKTLEESAETVLHRLEVILREARDDPAPVLHVNSSGLVVEYNINVPSGNQSKFYERIATFK